MIYTLTFNPAIDYSLITNNLEFGVTNRSESEEICFGGKGINVSYVLSQLGVENTALGFVAGFTGEYLVSQLAKNQIKTDFIKLESGFTRINVKLKGKQETEINAQGPDISETALMQLFSKLEKLKAEDTLVLAGSVPKSMPSDIYEEILKRLEDKGIRFVVDATGDLLKATLKYKPFLIKPNNFELEEILGEQFKTEEEIICGAKKLKEMGACNVMVSLGEKGLLLISDDGNVYKQDAFKISLVNSVGAGDSTIAGFLAGYEDGVKSALRLAAAAGAATAASNLLAQKEEIEKLMLT